MEDVMTALRWSPQQEAALADVNDWWKNRRKQQKIYRIFGFAGTGKSTLAKEIERMLKVKALYATFTGKAALVLRKKDCDASTIHSLIYEPVQCQVTGEVTFKINRDSGLADADLLIVDEVSMVDEFLGADVMSFGKPVLVLGDPMQLKPIKGQGYFTNAKPDVMLTEVHRQAAENPIIRLSMDVREGGRLIPGQYGESLIIRREDISREELGAKVIESDQLICGLNQTRTNFNARIRTMKALGGYPETWLPTAGDRLICLKNNREKHIFNGGMWTVQSVKRKKGASRMIVDSLDEKRAPLTISVFDEFFTGREKELDWRELKKSDQFTFGWAITCHKAQGSQFENPIVFDESGVFARGGEHINWLYTAITRASEKITVIV